MLYLIYDELAGDIPPNEFTNPSAPICNAQDFEVLASTPKEKRSFRVGIDCKLNYKIELDGKYKYSSYMNEDKCQRISRRFIGFLNRSLYVNKSEESSVFYVLPEKKLGEMQSSDRDFIKIIQKNPVCSDGTLNINVDIK